MAEKRRLLAEMDKVFRKVEEGVELFDETMSKMQEANSENQREKFQDDLKKEIKKLQRLRDHIKAWQNSNDVKDKDRLYEYRKVIEGKMEQFKDVERENKTKPHSKQGLNAEEKLDPKEKERTDTIEWLQVCIGRLNEQCDFLESTIESLNSVQTKRKRTKDGREKAKETGDCKHKLERHKFHIQKLELIMRLLNNDSIECEDVNNLREDLSDYIDRCQDDDFVENEFLYETLDLGDGTELIQQIGNVGSIGSTEESEGVGEAPVERPRSSGSSPTDNTKEAVPADSVADSLSGKVREKSGDQATRRDFIATRKNSASRFTPTTPSKLTSQLSHESSLLSSSTSTSPLLESTPPSTAGIPYNSIAAGNRASPLNTVKHHQGGGNGNFSVVEAKITPEREPEPEPVSDSAFLLQNENLVSYCQNENQFVSNENTTRSCEDSSTRMEVELDRASAGASAPISFPEENSVKRTSPSLVTSSLVSSSVDINLNDKSSAAETVVLAENIIDARVSETLASVSASLTSEEQPQQLQQEGSASSNWQENGAQNLEVVMNGPASESSATGILPLRNIAAQAVENANSGLIAAGDNRDNTSTYLSIKQQADGDSGIPPFFTALLNRAATASTQGLSQEEQKANIPASLGASPLGKVSLSADNSARYQRLDSAINRMTMPMDSERLRLYIQRNPCQTPSYYPQCPPPLSETLEYFNRLSTETLFFVFYYMEGTKAQYLAAKALKKQSWRFHKKYLMWFQRHEEPKCITDDFEQGTYIYFDFEKWIQRKKEGFTFEYKYLEDRDLS